MGIEEVGYLLERAESHKEEQDHVTKVIKGVWGNVNMFS